MDTEIDNSELQDICPKNDSFRYMVKEYFERLMASSSEEELIID